MSTLNKEKINQKINGGALSFLPNTNIKCTGNSLLLFLH